MSTTSNSVPLSLTEQLLSFVLSYSPEEMSDELLEWTALRFVDTVGVALVCASYDFGSAATRVVQSEPSSGKSSVWASGGMRVRSDDAGFANGMLSHGMDFDDTHSSGTMHPSVVLVATALAVGEETGATGREILVSAMLGYEVMARLALLSPGKFQSNGFHPTSVVGIFGAVAIANRLMGMSLADAVNAAGIAGSMASGLMEYLSDGSDTKQMHPGWAAKGAITAAKMALQGATGPKTVLEGRSGVYKSFIGIDINIEDALEDLGTKWQGTLVSTKPYPACHCVHGPVDSWLALRKRLNFSDADIANIRRFTGLVPSWYLQLVCDPLDAKQAPRSVYEARFSLPYSVAAAVVDGKLGIESYEEDRLSDERILEVAKRVDYEILEYDEFPEAFPGGIRIEMQDGTIYEEHLRHNVGSVQNPMSKEDIFAKFRECARRVTSEESAEKLLASLSELVVASSPKTFSDAMSDVDAHLAKPAK